MCNILRFLPGQSMDEEKFFNCVYNNWHSYGFVTKNNDKLDIKRVVPKSGEVDPKELWTLLKKHQEVERIIHVRHTTAGVTNLENCHPFDVLYVPSTGRQIVFMHNGTMGDYKSKIYDGNIAKDDNTGPSDTKNFVDQILQPYCQIDYGTGPGDLSNPLFKKIVQKFWPYGNRGILIANDQPSFFLGDWKEYGVGDIIKVANTDYFDKVTRGPEFDRRKAAEEAAKIQESRFQTANTQSKITSFGNLKDFNFGDRHDFYNLSESAVNILQDWEVYDRSNAVTVGNLKRNEIEEIYKEKSTCVTLMDWIFSDYSQLYKEYLTLEEKHRKASNKIAELVEINKSYDQGKVRVG